MARTMSLTRGFASHGAATRDEHATPRLGNSGPTKRPRRHTDSDGSAPPVTRPKSASNMLRSPAGDEGSTYDLDDVYLGGDGARRRHGANEFAALIDFLRNNPPPPGNFMSVPYGDGDGDGRGRWSKIKRISRRSKSMPRPQRIRLPDSAVSGTTIGGHRHIAISIPLDASPFNDVARSQYPIYGSDEKNQYLARNTPFTFTNDKGVVTVLRTVNEDHEPTTPSTPLSSHPPMPWSTNHRPSASLGRASLSTGPRSRGNMQGKYYDNGGSIAGSSKTPIFDQYRTIGKPSPEQQRAGTPGSQSAEFQRSAYPPRQSSMMPAPAHVIQPTSIDDMIAPRGGARTGGIGARDRRSADSVPGSTATDDGEQATSKSAQPTKTRKVPKPLDFADSMEMGGLRNDSLKPHTPALAESPLLPPNEDTGPLPARKKSRRDAVRDRKRRDIEAMRSAKQKQQQQDQELQQEEEQQGQAQEQGTSRAEKLGKMKAEPETKADPANRLSAATVVHKPEARAGEERPSSAAGPTFSPIVVVVDVEPDYAPEKRPIKSRSQQMLSPSVDSFATALDAGTDGRDASTLTPPVSGSESPPRRHSGMDRTSLSRRREWNATREKERKAREAKEAARAKAKQLVAAGHSYEHVKASQTDKEILRLYEAYRDQRLREMERRVRRLERNGDVWLRALVPVLDNVNRTMGGGGTLPGDAARGWASEDEAGSAPAAAKRQNGAPRRPHSDRGVGVSRQANLTPGRLMEQLRQRDEGDGWSSSGSGSGSDDTTGLEAIEPLMRELAGEARRRQKATVAAQRLGVGAAVRAQ